MRRTQIDAACNDLAKELQHGHIQAEMGVDYALKEGTSVGAFRIDGRWEAV